MISPRPSDSIPDRQHGPWRRLISGWEFLLLIVGVVIFFLNVQASPYFLDPWNLSDATFNFTEKAMIAFAMALVPSQTQSSVSYTHLTLPTKA